MLGRDFFAEECRIENLRSFYGTMEIVEAEKGALLFPGSSLQTNLRVPEALRDCVSIHPHVRSTFARLGINAHFDQTQYARFLGGEKDTLLVGLVNWGSYPVLIRLGDTIVLANSSEVSGCPQIYPSNETGSKYPWGHLVRAGNTKLEIRKDELPTIKLPSGNAQRFIDPQSDRVSDITELTTLASLSLETGDFVVIEAAEPIHIPEGCIGLLHNWLDGAVHSSARLLYPGWRGKLAMEFMVYAPLTLYPGKELGIVTVHRPYNEVPTYNGRYQSQESIHPQPKNAEI